MLFVSTDRFLPNTEGAVHAFCHALPGTWHQMGVILSATDSLNWLARLFQAEPAALVAGLGETLSGPSPALFLPYLAGERTPHNDTAARGAFLGLGHDIDRPQLLQAVLEGVAFAFRDCLNALESAGSRIARATAVGGGAASRLWLSILANVLDLSLDRPKCGELGAAFGAARLGMAAALGADPAALMTPAPAAESVEPEPELVARYAEAYARYRALYPATRAIMPG